MPAITPHHILIGEIPFFCVVVIIKLSGIVANASIKVNGNTDMAMRNAMNKINKVAPILPNLVRYYHTYTDFHFRRKFDP